MSCLRSYIHNTGILGSIQQINETFQHNGCPCHVYIQCFSELFHIQITNGVPGHYHFFKQYPGIVHKKINLSQFLLYLFCRMFYHLFICYIHLQNLQIISVFCFQFQQIACIPFICGVSAASQHRVAPSQSFFYHLIAQPPVGAGH